MDNHWLAFRPEINLYVISKTAINFSLYTKWYDVWEPIIEFVAVPLVSA